MLTGHCPVKEVVKNREVSVLPLQGIAALD